MRLRDTPFAPLLLALAAAATVLATTLSWQAFTVDPSGYLWSLMLVGLVVAVAGATARWARLGGPLVVLAQLLLGAATVSLLVTGAPLPYGGAWHELVADVQHAGDVIRTMRPPVPVTGGIAPVLLGGGLLCFVAVDLLACTLRRPALAGLPLLAVYAVPFSVVEGGLPWWGFALSTMGFLSMLVLQQAETVSRWGRRLEASVGVRGGGGASVGAVALACALVLPAFVPTLDLQFFGLGPGSGDGGRIRVTNPLVDLRRDLVRGPDVPVVQVTTDDPAPSYLRIAVLTRFGDNEWTAGDRTVPLGNDAEGPLPSLLGVASWVERTTHHYAVSIDQRFDSRWLPTQSPISEIHAPGDWRYDSRTMDFLSGRSGQTAAGLDYTMTAVDLDLTTADLVDALASPGTVGTAYLDLPADFPDSARQLAASVTASADGDFAKAVALQSWFRQDGGFVYDDQVALGSSPGDLEHFLTRGPDGRRGYCQQFAAAMAAMARSLDIPARVAVGFLSPERGGPRTWTYSTHDMHAWPELFFSGAGWVRFEPTPADRASAVPGYTVNFDNGRPDPEPTAAPSTANPSTNPSRAARPVDEQQTANGSSTTPTRTVWTWVGATVAVLAVLAALALLPSRLRRRRRAARLASGTPEDAWAELRDTIVDLGLPWPSGRSPRRTAAALAGYVAGDAARDALDRLVEHVELSRYSLHPAAMVGRDDVERVLAALRASTPERAARRATWWPRSVLQRAPAEEAEPRELVDQVG